MHKILLPVVVFVSSNAAPLFGANQGIKPPTVHTHCFYRLTPAQIEEKLTLRKKEAEFENWVSAGFIRNPLPIWVRKSLLEKSAPSDPCLDQGDLSCSFRLKLDGTIEDLVVENSAGLKPSDDTILRIFKNVKFEPLPDESWPYNRKFAIIFSRHHAIWFRVAPVEPIVTPKARTHTSVVEKTNSD